MVGREELQVDCIYIWYVYPPFLYPLIDEALKILKGFLSLSLSLFLLPSKKKKIALNGEGCKPVEMLIFGWDAL